MQSPEQPPMQPPLRASNERRWSDMSELHHPLLASPSSPWSARASRVFSLHSPQGDSAMPHPVTRASSRSSFFPPLTPPSPPPNTHATHTAESVMEQAANDPDSNPVPPLPSTLILPAIRREPSIKLFHPVSLTPARGPSRLPSRAPSSRIPSRAPSTSAGSLKRERSRKPKELRTALFSRIASNRSKQYDPVHNDDTPPSPSSVYSQASASSWVWAELEGGPPEDDIPPLSPLPENEGLENPSLTRTASFTAIKSHNPFAVPSSDPEDRELSRLENNFAFSVSPQPHQSDFVWVSNAIKGFVPASTDSNLLTPPDSLRVGRRAMPALPSPVIQNTNRLQAAPQHEEVEQGLKSATGTLSYSLPASQPLDGQTRPLSIHPSSSQESSPYSRRVGLVIA